MIIAPPPPPSPPPPHIFLDVCLVWGMQKVTRSTFNVKPISPPLKISEGTPFTYILLFCPIVKKKIE
jgi:hypothetical protein